MIAPVPSRRRRRSHPVLGLAACLLVIAVLVAIRPDPVTDFRRSYADVALNQPGRLRTFDITVTGVQRVAAVPRSAVPFTSDQALVVVELEGSARVAPSYFNKITVTHPR